MKDELEKYPREVLISNIKKRIDILKNACSNVRTLNGTIVLLVGYGLVIDLRKLVADWDYDNRPTLNNFLIRYLNFNEYYFLNEEFEKLSIEELSDIDLFHLHTYIQHIVPKPILD